MNAFFASSAGRRWIRRLTTGWWRRQPIDKQDRYATFGPLVSVLLFLAAIISAFWYLRNEEFERKQEAVRRDTEVAQQQIRLRLLENQEQLSRMAREIVTKAIDREAFDLQAATFTSERPEIGRLFWLGPKRELIAQYSYFGWRSELGNASDDITYSLPKDGSLGEPEIAFLAARKQHQAIYGKPFVAPSSEPVIQMHLPLVDHGNFTGMLVAEYSLETLMRYYVPPEIAQRHAMSLMAVDGSVLASTVSSLMGQRVKRTSIEYDVTVPPVKDGLTLRGQGSRTSIGLISNTLFWMVAALSVLTVWMLLGTWRHMQRRLQMQNALVSEANFRRAMENSMLTGMRAVDMNGRITYVNPAFCAMTGFAETELIGREPPFPHWPRDRIDENQRLFQQELQGRSPAGGIEVKVMRKDGSNFDARMYVSPLIDARGQQTGWMTSMTNITEAKRIRDQLSASHERFTTVLEGLDAAVSVLSVQQGELLFANHSYRLWFGADGRGHAQLAGSEVGLPRIVESADEEVDTLGGLPTQEITETAAQPREVFVDSAQKWFDVRTRYLQWTDGRLAQMLIATDITARLHAEAVAAGQAEKAQQTSRLVTMGEMASSVAHELNQPLTAIANYCNGMISRVRNDAITDDELIVALEKTSKQAQRAGQIIHRIRAFVKRSEPQRQRAQARDIVEDAVELANIELRRRNVAIQTYVAQRLPPLTVDPILIEQVVLNLLKNAAEAIDNAGLPPNRRTIELRVAPRHTPEQGGVIEFSVTDKGPGIKEEAIARLFEAFFSTKVEGLGIGLSLCRTIIESHQGRMRAENLYNDELVIGARFSFTLPVVGLNAEAAATPNPPSPSSSITT